MGKWEGGSVGLSSEMGNCWRVSNREVTSSDLYFDRSILAADLRCQEAGEAGERLLGEHRQ